MLTRYELERYARQISISEVGEDGQRKLGNARVLVAGAGGLGSAASVYLALAGVGAIRIVDKDAVELSNLNRQMLYGDGDIRKEKSVLAEERLKSLNPAVTVEGIRCSITESTVNDILADMDVVIDALDNMQSRYLLNKAAIEHGVPFLHGAVHGFDGRAMTVIPGESACLRCLYRGPVRRRKVPVIGVAPAIIGCIQATEALKYILKIGELLANRLLVFDGLKMKVTELKINRNPRCDHCGRP